MKFGDAIVYVDDVPTVLDFYRRAFGAETRFIHESQQYGELETGETPDIPAAFDKAVDAGAVAVMEPQTKPWGQTVAYVRSIEGSVIELCTPVGV
jgi:uncharacterized glyoxalase superfamily protein PhnB